MSQTRNADPDGFRRRGSNEDGAVRQALVRRSDLGRLLEPVAFGLLLAVHLLPIWVVQYFPTQDGPAHVYNTTQFLDLLRGDAPAARYYEVNLHGFPNWTTTVLLAGFLQWCSPETAEKWVASVYVLGLPLSMRYLLVARQTDAAWLAWLSLPLVYNDFLHRGFYNFLLGLVLMCLAIGYWLRRQERPTPGALTTFCALVTLLYLTHLVAFGALVVSLGVLTVGALVTQPGIENLRTLFTARRRAIRNTSLWLLCLAPGSLLALQFVLSQKGAPWDFNYHWKTAAWVLYAMAAAANSPSHLLASALLPVLWFAVLIYVARQQRPDALVKWNRDGFFFCSLIFIVLYLAAPGAAAGGSFLNQRLALIAFLLAVPFVAGTSFQPRARGTVITASAGLALLLIVLNVRLNSSLQGEMTQFVSAGTVMKPHRTLVTVCLADEGCGAGTQPGRLRIAPLSHASGYIAAERHLIDLTNDQAHAAFFPIRFVARRDPSPFQNVVTDGFRRSWDPLLPDYSESTGGVIDYVLLWGGDDAVRRKDDISALMKWLARDFHVTLRSPDGRVRVYSRRGE